MNMSLISSLIKEFTPSNKRYAEDIVREQNCGVRSFDIESLYISVKYDFSHRMKEGSLRRDNILKIRHYLESKVSSDNRKFKNDCHCIYYLLGKCSSKKVLEKVSFMLKD